MTNPDTGPHSIREVLTLWYIRILAAILILFGGALYVTVVTGLTRDVDKTLALRADQIAATIVAFREAEESTTSSAIGNWNKAPSVAVFGGVGKGELHGLLRRWARGTDHLTNEHLFRVVDGAGRPLVSSDNFSRLDLPLTASVVADALKKNTVYETFVRKKQRIRLVTRPVIENNRVRYLVQAAAFMNQVGASADRLLLSLVVLIPAILIVARYAGLFLAATALEPVAMMISQAKRISSQRLEERISVPETSDELRDLSLTLNDMLARLQNDFRRLRQFSAAASHELRTPLTVIRGELEVALRRPRTSEEYQRVLQMHLEKAEAMSTIVEELLTLAHNEAVETALRWEPVNLNALVKEVSGAWRKIAKEKLVQVEVQSRETVWINGERRLLERLAANLLDNAIKHTPTHGMVTLTVGLQEKQACLIVRDTGHGIPPEELPTVFDRFFKKESPNSEMSSTGLGLGLCRWIAEVHSGQLSVSSPPGQGAIFMVRFPAVPPPAV